MELSTTHFNSKSPKSRSGLIGCRHVPVLFTVIIDKNVAIVSQFSRTLNCERDQTLNQQACKKKHNKLDFLVPRWDLQVDHVRWLLKFPVKTICDCMSSTQANYW
ncbi:hypothetical protein L1987_48352 [Smallanthus sonchifolius]|uniref:Uncharacterized protein n=1 Tax=Smallanthus sonchifolius TaxID=185202 RepID=A0ACB9FTC8_9ASTR|nr:hypothetical protein L1987_48352 [Smallanthus sonchifolius]